MQNSRLTTILPFFGAIPFIAGAALLTLHIDTIHILTSIPVLTALKAYTLLIASFMLGIHWGQSLSTSGYWRDYLSIYTNILAILLWISFVKNSANIFFFFSAIYFLVYLFIDRKLMHRNDISKQYFWVRLLVSIIVVVSLVVAGIYV